MDIRTSDRIAALEIAHQAEPDAVDRAGRSGNCVAAAINRLRLKAAENRLNAAVAAANN